MEKKNIVLKDMGSFMCGGTVIHREDGSVGHFEHGYAQWYVPADATDLPMIFWHGNGQSGKCWESTPDGRDGFREIFLRRDVPVYVIDQPRRGRASYSEKPHEITYEYPSIEREEANWEIFRFGPWQKGGHAHLYEGTQVPDDPQSINQFIRQMCHTHGDQPITYEYGLQLCQSTVELLKWSGDAMLFTHSLSGKYGWFTPLIDNTHVKAVFSYEPGNTVMPDDIEIKPVETPCAGLVDIMAPYIVPAEQFNKLTKFPIRIYYGDYIVKDPIDDYGYDCWRMSIIMMKDMAAEINRRGGNAKVILLPELGIRGNTHNFMGEKNNVQLANLFFDEMKSLGLLKKDKPYQGPARQELTDFDVIVEKGCKFGG